MEGSRCFAGVCQKKKNIFPTGSSNSRPTDIRTVYFIFFFFFLSVYLFPFWFWFFHGLIIAFRLVTPSLTHDSFVCILAGSYMRSEGEKRKGKPTRRVKLTIDYTATVRVGIYGFKRRRVAAELLSSTSSFKKWEKKSIGKQHQLHGGELNVGDANGWAFFKNWARQTCIYKNISRSSLSLSLQEFVHHIQTEEIWQEREG